MMRQAQREKEVAALLGKLNELSVSVSTFKIPKE